MNKDTHGHSNTQPWTHQQRDRERHTRTGIDGPIDTWIHQHTGIWTRGDGHNDTDIRTQRHKDT